MNKLTDKQRRRIRLAFLKVDSDKEHASCVAIAPKYKHFTPQWAFELREQYGEFFDQNSANDWDLTDPEYPDYYGQTYDFKKAARLMLLATFYVLAGEVSYELPS